MIIFKNLSIWVTTYILSFLENQEILKFRTVNKKARQACQKAYEARRIDLSNISLKTAKFFERAQTLFITEKALTFFDQFQDHFMQQVFDHYANVKHVCIDLGMLFVDSDKEKILGKVSEFTLNHNTDKFSLIRSQVTGPELNLILQADKELDYVKGEQYFL